MSGFTLKERDGITLLSGKVDSSNAPIFEKKLKEIEGDIILDLSDFSYISSAGLRVLLRLAKERKDAILRIVNVPDEIWQIFSMTGFTDILDVTRKQRSISIEGCELIGQGACGKIYRLDPETIVKVYSPSTEEVIITSELECSHQALRHGLNTAIAFDIVDVGGQKGVVYELLDSKTLAWEFSEHPESFDALTEKFRALAKQIHSIEPKEGVFRECCDMYHSCLDYVSQWYTASEISEMSRLLDSIPRRGTLIHGDFHAKNIMVVKGELTLIDMGEMGVGNPLFDLMPLVDLYHHFVVEHPLLAPRILGMPNELTERVRQRFLSLYFEEDEETTEKITTALYGYAELRSVLTIALGGINDDKMRNHIIDNSRIALLPHIDEFIRNGEILWRYI